jgi:hypothetical protein
VVVLGALEALNPKLAKKVELVVLVLMNVSGISHPQAIHIRVPGGIVLIYISEKAIPLLAKYCFKQYS